MPPIGQNVVVTLADGTETLAYWKYDQWWVGVDFNPEDQVIEGVVSWRWAE